MYVPHEELVDDYREVLVAFNKCVQALNRCDYRVRNSKILDLAQLSTACGESHYQYRSSLIKELTLLANYLTVVNGLINQGMLATLTDAVVRENEQSEL